MSSPFLPSPVTYLDFPAGGVPAPLIIAARVPSNTIDKQYSAGYFWLCSRDMSTIVNGVVTYGNGSLYYQSGNSSGLPNWQLVNNVGAISGTSLTATTGNITANQGNIVATLGSVSGVSLTASAGDVTATTGNFVASASGAGLVLNSPTATGAAASPLVLNGRSGRAVFTTVSIAAAADLTLTITNSAVTSAATQILYTLSGTTTGSALSIKSVTNSAGSSVLVITNGTGATTSVSNITLTFMVLN